MIKFMFFLEPDFHSYCPRHDVHGTQWVEKLTSGNKKEVADILKIDRKTLYRRLEEYGWTDS